MLLSKASISKLYVPKKVDTTHWAKDLETSENTKFADNIETISLKIENCVSTTLNSHKLTESIENNDFTQIKLPNHMDAFFNYFKHISNNLNSDYQSPSSNEIIHSKNTLNKQNNTSTENNISLNENNIPVQIIYNKKENLTRKSKKIDANYPNLRINNKNKKIISSEYDKYSIWERSQLRLIVKSKKLKKLRSVDKSVYTFEPEINQNSIKIVNSRQNSFSDRMNYYLSKQASHLEELKDGLDSIHSIDCTFKPQISQKSIKCKRTLENIFLDHELSKKKIEEMKQYLENKTLKDCSFQPNSKYSPIKPKESQKMNKILKNNYYKMDSNEFKHKSQPSNENDIDFDNENGSQFNFENISNYTIDQLNKNIENQTSKKKSIKSIQNSLQSTEYNNLNHSQINISNFSLDKINSKTQKKKTQPQSKLMQVLKSSESYEVYLQESKWKKEYEKKMLLIEQEKKEMEECSFKPEIHEVPDWIHSISESSKILKSQLKSDIIKMQPRWVN